MKKRPVEFDQFRVWGSTRFLKEKLNCWSALQGDRGLRELAFSGLHTP